jgi:hypothetical protein
VAGGRRQNNSLTARLGRTMTLTQSLLTIAVLIATSAFFSLAEI